MAIESVIVVGAGQMGAGIAQVAAQAGLLVTLVDVMPAVLAKGQERIKDSLARLVKKGTATQADADAPLARVKGAASIGAAGAADFAVEAVTENEELKKKIFQELDGVVKPGGVIAS